MMDKKNQNNSKLLSEYNSNPEYNIKIDTDLQKEIRKEDIENGRYLAPKIILSLEEKETNKMRKKEGYKPLFATP